MNIVETLMARKEMMDAAMKDFETNRNPQYIIGFYSSLIRTLASDKQSSTDEVVRMLKKYKVEV